MHKDRFVHDEIFVDSEADLFFILYGVAVKNFFEALSSARVFRVLMADPSPSPKAAQSRTVSYGGCLGSEFFSTLFLSPPRRRGSRFCLIKEGNPDSRLRGNDRRGKDGLF